MENNNALPKKDVYLKLINGNAPDALCIMGGGLSRHKINHKNVKNYIKFLYQGNKPNSINGTEARVIAAVELFKYFPTIKIVTLSHKLKPVFFHFLNYLIETTGIRKISLAKKMANELLKMDIPKSQIIICEKSTSTVTEIMEIIFLSAKNNWKNIVLISNDYHIQRIKDLLHEIRQGTEEFYQKILQDISTKEEQKKLRQLFETLSFGIIKLKNEGAKIIAISAESILSEKGRIYHEVVKEVEKEKAYKNVEKNEEKGRIEIIKGNYNFNNNNTFTEYLKAIYKK